MIDGLFKRLRRASSHAKNKGSNAEGIFSLTSAYITLETKLELSCTYRAGFCIKNVNGTNFDDTIREVQEFLRISRSEFLTEDTMVDDRLGYLWIMIKGKSTEDILVVLNGVAETFEEAGFRDQLLAAVFEFRSDANDHNAYQGPQYLIYNYKRANFYPFVPVGSQEKRADDLELKIMSVISKETPWENDMSVWYPMWDMPFDKIRV
jgi:hypothetical protein